uniref:Dof-type domain-containing protein n=1 Tax=Physcomitrium patens TaxID=3218 RepID=A0A7I4EPX6_PHYPA
MRLLHWKGYLQIPILEPIEFMVQIKVCPRCKSSTHVRFLDLNNKSPKQPRYRCRKCKLNFSPFKTRGQVPKKVTNEAVQAMDTSTELIDAPDQVSQLLALYEISENLIQGIELLESTLDLLQWKHGLWIVLGDCPMTWVPLLFFLRTKRMVVLQCLGRSLRPAALTHTGFSLETCVSEC